jgi:type IX secretion system PorP/SprF family membrane protein
MLLYSQQFSMPSQPARNMVYINPAYTGYFETTVASLMNRTTWIGTTGSLQYQNAEVHAPLKKQSIALGLQFLNQKIGASNTTEAFFNYCHRIPMGGVKLALGIKLGIQSVNLSAITMRDIDDPASEAHSALVPNFGVGFAFYSKLFYAGLSVPYLLGYQTGSDGNTSISHDFNNYSIIASAGGKIPIGSIFKVEPAIVYNYSLTLESAYMAIVNLNINDKLVFGVGYRSEPAAVINLGYYLNNQVSFQYTYDYNFGTGYVGTYSKGSHEIGLLFYFGYKVNTVSPRDF